ncbi:MAG: biotin/lipoate--protein ligase family protein [Sneathiella sp.]|nr:biotin/lipoate--protein ligase family protein [Sneathiella sp.]
MADPASIAYSQEDPTFPPLLSGHRTEPSENPAVIAVEAAQTHSAGAGDLFWSPREDHLQFALILEPEVPAERCYEMLYTAMVAFTDAAGAIMPPEISVTYSWPSSLLVNDGEVGSVDLVISSQKSDAGVPDWLVISMDIEMKSETLNLDPGLTYHRTTFWDEGCGHISRTELLNSLARHFLSWLNNWQEEGFSAIHKLWMQRLPHKENVDIHYEGKLLHGDILGLDETGNALFKSGPGSILLQTEIALLGKRELLGQKLVDDA